MSSNKREAFRRFIKPENMEILHRLATAGDDNWFKDALQDSDVFFALRDNRVDAYAKGALVHRIEFKNGKAIPHTHVKYLIKEPQKSRSYISLENEEFRYTPAESMQTKYVPGETLKSIKAAALYYSPPSSESYGVSSILTKNPNVIDIEFSLKQSSDESAEPPVQSDNGPKSKHDRIDIVHLEKSKEIYRLVFWEAKLYVNPDLFNNKIIDQINRYSIQIKRHKHKIIDAYRAVCQFQNDINTMRSTERTNCALQGIADGSIELDLDPEPRLAIFTYDGRQKERLMVRVEMLSNMLGKNRIKMHGDPSKLTLR
ncbi:hypothetical protein ABDF71_24785 [Ochrobactrum sp. WV_118_8]|uniref:hypothetical protein n=1 Tax=Ochrobactrum sp. CGA5 TaxID=2583453 RepID=UPI0011239C06|nr:hypothetical protein [Ochrobactrum sp. CGA5]